MLNYLKNRLQISRMLNTTANETVAAASPLSEFAAPYVSEYAGVIPGGEATLSVIAFAILAVIFYSVVMAIFQTIKMMTRKTKTTLDDHLIKNLRRPMKWISVILAAYLSLQLFYPDFNLWGHSLDNLFTIMFLIVGTYTVNALFSAFMGWYAEEMAPKTDSKFDDEIFPLFKKIGSALIYVIGLTIVLSTMGIEVSALIAALGVGGLAVALALQDTLGNFFAGVHLLADRPVRPGDYIKIDGTDVIGTIEEIGWRSTRIRTWDNNIVYVPNSKMSASIIINYFNPQEEMGYAMTFGVSYDDDPEEVIDALKEALARTSEETGKIVEAESSTVRADSFGDSSVNYKVIVKIPVYGDRFGVHGEMVKQIFYVFKERGISIPYPTTTVYMHEEEKGKKETRPKGKKKKKA
ncbi:mechanosensitive ion channel [Candidatus Micrarchaeota archaeon]|nr:mechanosensitive ion channel [Candidatus Micrarchaeota archaeon]MBD3417806.1 mechanosensitive ion channel [Candidatus Micrarchaeota archaeon]